MNLSISQPSFVTFWGKNYSCLAKLLVEPGNNYRISIDADKNVKITGANEKGQMLYTTFPNPFTVEGEIRKIGYPYNDSTNVSFVRNKINDIMQIELSKLKELLDNKEISKDFFDWIQKDRIFFYTALEARFLI